MAQTPHRRRTRAPACAVAKRRESAVSLGPVARLGQGQQPGRAGGDTLNGVVICSYLIRRRGTMTREVPIATLYVSSRTPSQTCSPKTKASLLIVGDYLTPE